MSGVVYNKPQPGVLGWGLGAQGGSSPAPAGGTSIFGGAPATTAGQWNGDAVSLFTGKPIPGNGFSGPNPLVGSNPFAGMTPGSIAPSGPIVGTPNSTYNKPTFDFTKAGLGAQGQTPAAPDVPNPWADLLNMALHPGGGTGTVKSSYDLKGALSDVAGVYAPQLSALDQLIAQKKGNATDNAAKLKALYASLVSGTQQAGVQGDQHYTDLMGKQSAATQAERDAITQRYAAQIADMQKQMTTSGFANLIPVRTQKIQDQMNHELANINTQGDIGQNQSRGLQGAQHNWYGESANVNAGQGTNAQAANMRQLQDALNQISQQRGTILSNEAQAQMGARNANRASISAAQAASNKAAAPDLALAFQIMKNQQDQQTSAAKTKADASQQYIANAIAAINAGKGGVSPTTGQSTYDPSITAKIQALIAAGS